MASADYKGIVDFAQAIDDTYVRKDAPSVPVGGAKGEVLRKKSNADGDAEWANPLYHFSTLAEMQAALALGQIPDGANVSVEEEQPGGNTGDTSLDTTSENWVQNKVVAAAVEQLNSDLASKDISAYVTIRGDLTAGTKIAKQSAANVSLIIELRGTINSGENIGALSAPIRPSAPFGIPVYNSNTGAPLDAAIWLYDTGEIKYYGSNLTSATYIRFQTSYVI